MLLFFVFMRKRQYCTLRIFFNAVCWQIFTCRKCCKNKKGNLSFLVLASKYCRTHMLSIHQELSNLKHNVSTAPPEVCHNTYLLAFKNDAICICYQCLSSTFVVTILRIKYAEKIPGQQKVILSKKNTCIMIDYCCLPSICLFV